MSEAIGNADGPVVARVRHELGAASMEQATRGAFERLLRLARSDTHQSRRVANFILAWWNAADLGGFDIADLFAVDESIARDMAAVFSTIADRSTPEYPDAWRAEIEDIIRHWRPDVWARAIETS